LQQRVTSLESQLSESKRLLDLKNAELAQMQKRLTAKEPTATSGAAKAPPVQTQPPAPAATATPTPVTTPEAPPVAEATPEPAPEAAPVQSTPKPLRPIATPAPEPEPSLLDRLGDYWLLISALGVALIAALIFYFRRRAEPHFEGGAETMTARDFGALDGGFGDATHLRDEPQHHSFDELEPDAEAVPVADSFADDEPAPVTVARATTPRQPAAKAIDETFSSDTAVRLDQQDALAEADFHMAYGLYDQAADLVKIAIAREPNRRDLKLKLLEIYFVWGNKDLFLETARDLHATRDTAPAGEWDKILIMGKQISPEEPMFKGSVTTGRSADLVDVNLEGGENRVDIDLYAAPDGAESSALDLDLAANSGVSRSLAAGKESSLDFLLDEPTRGADDEPTREMDTTARTQETPTIESPFLADTSSQTLREEFDAEAYGREIAGADQTAELSLDDLGLDVGNLEETGRLEDTGSLSDTGTVDGGAAYGLESTAERERPLADDELTRIAQSPRIEGMEKTVETPRPDTDKTMLAPHIDADKLDNVIDTESTGTIYLEDVDFPSEAGKYDVDSTASFKVTQKLDMDLDRLGEFHPGNDSDTVKHTSRRADEDDRFSEEVFSDGNAAGSHGLDLDVGHAFDADDRAPTATEVMADALELPELEPVTMSEVGTKLDLARAYMDMGDPDGARSILEEVLGEGNSGQKQEAQRLLDSIR
jgi:pilus assembly protein FimV